VAHNGERLERGLRDSIAVVFVLGLRWRNPGAVVNAVVAYLGTHLPAVLERALGAELRPWQRVYIVAAMAAHSVGMLGPYDENNGWDHLTHVLSSSILGGVVFTLARRRDRPAAPRVLSAVIGIGLLWELLEYAIHAVADRLGIEPILVSYSRSDTILDLLFNLVGAVLVIAFGDRALKNVIETDE